MREVGVGESCLQDEVLVVGGGVSGCAAAIGLARAGRRVRLIERETEVRHKVCGEFLSGEALEDLGALGIDVAGLGAVRVGRVRLVAGGGAAEAELPFAAASLTRKALDTALMAEAVAAGVEVERGRSVQGLERGDDGVWRATLEDGSTRAAGTVFLATGKHDLRGHRRPDGPRRWVALKMYLRLSAEQAGELAGACELMLYPGGYGGMQPVEDGMVNLCCVVEQRYLPKGADRWEGFVAMVERACPHLARRMEGAEPLLERPLAVTHIPYGYLRGTTEEGMYCIGDQAAVIPSFTGDGISIALHTARRAVAAYVAGEAAAVFQARLRRELRPQMRLATLAAGGMNSAVGRAVLPLGLRVWPGVMRLMARLTRVARQGVAAAAA